MNSCQITYIYGLYEVGKDQDLRYIGKTDNPRSRLSSHKYSSIKNRKLGNRLTHKECWFLKVLDDGGSVELKVIEECDQENWCEREIYWIDFFPNLTNISPGGEDGITGCTFEISYSDCKKWISENYPNIKSKKEYHINSSKFPNFIPKSPNTVFVDWVSWGDFLNSGFHSSREKSRKYLTYIECKKWIRENLDLEKNQSWSKLSKDLPFFIPKKPNIHFGNQWIDWVHFLGYEINKKYVSYSECQKFIRSLNISSSREWYEFYKNHKDIQQIMPLNISTVYKKEFTSWTDFLNSSKKSVDIKREALSYDELLKYVIKNLNFIKSSRYWKNYIRQNKIKGIPINPQVVYKNKGWTNWKDFLDKN
jgi:hypothetical protein